MRFRKGIVALAAAGLVLTACTSGEDGGEGGAAAIASPPADASGTLTVWLMRGSQPESVVDAVNATFKESFPKVAVDVQLQEWAGIHDKLTTSLATDSTPDLVEIGNSLTAKYADAGLLADVSAYASGLGIEDMLPGLKESGDLEGVRYGVPYYGGVRIVVYKKSDFEKANVEVPTSLADLETVAGKLHKVNEGNSEYSAFYFPGKYWYGAVPFVWTNGGDIASQDEAGEWLGILNSPQSIMGLNQLKSLVDRYSKAPKEGDETQNVDAFNTGNVGMMIDSWWAPGILDTGDLQGDIGAFALPGVEAQTTAPVYATGSDLGIAARSKNQGLALEWIKILTSLGIQTELAREGGVIPNQQGAFVGHEGNPFLQVADEASINSRFTPVSPNWPSVESSQVLQDMLVKIFTEAATVEEATTAASGQITTTLNGG